MHHYCEEKASILDVRKAILAVQLGTHCRKVRFRGRDKNQKTNVRVRDKVCQAVLSELFIWDTEIAVHSKAGQTHVIGNSTQLSGTHNVYHLRALRDIFQ